MVSKLKTTVEWIDLFFVPAVCQNLRRSRPSSIASDSRPISQYGFCIHKVRRAVCLWSSRLSPYRCIHLPTPDCRNSGIPKASAIWAAFFRIGSDGRFADAMVGF